MKKARWLVIIVSIIMIAAFGLSACQTKATESPAEAPAVEEPAATEEAVATEAAVAGEAAEATEAATEVAVTSPAVGGTFVQASIEEPDTLDIYKSSFAIASAVTANLGAALVAKDADGKMVPYLAESWDISEDGLTYTFHLRQDVKFHNGEPFTANDYVWTWDRCLAEGFVCPVSASMLTFTYEATDDYTLVLHLTEPNYYTLTNLGAYDYLQPLNQKAVEEVGETYGMGNTAVGVGPYMLEEWVQDEKIVLKRNPDFTWGPVFFEGANTGPYYVDKLEFRILPDQATILAGLEANELDYSQVEAKDLQTIKDTNYFQIFDFSIPQVTYLSMNLRNEKFADVKVRQALNMAVNKEVMVQVTLSGEGDILDGMLAPAMIGYDESTAKGTGYAYDVDAAKALFQEAGYTYGDDGMLIDPNGNPYTIELLTTSEELSTKMSTILVDMFKQVGVTVNITQLEWGTMAPLVFGGEYEMCTMSVGWPDAGVLRMMYHSSNIGALNFAFSEDPELDVLLDATLTDIDPAVQQESVNAVYKMLQEKALSVPLFSMKAFYTVSNDFQGVQTSPYIGIINSDMYYVGE